MHCARNTTPLVAGVLAAWLSAVGLLGYNHNSLSGDLAEYVNNPVRVLHGEMPYRDFWLLHPPGEVFLPAAVYYLGFGVNAVLLVSVCVSVLTGLAAFWVGRMTTGSNVEGTLAAALVFFAGVPFEYHGYVYLHAYLLFLLVAAGLLAGYLTGYRRRDLYFAGVAVGFAFLFRVYLTGAAAAALFATVLLEARGRNRPWGETARSLTIFCLGCLVVVAGASMCMCDLVPEMWYAVIVDSISHAAVNRPVYGYSIIGSWTGFTEYLGRLCQNPARAGAYLYFAFASSHLLKTGLMLALPFLSALLWLFGRRKGAKTPELADWMVLFFLLWGSLTFIRAFTRGGHPAMLSQAVTPLFFILVLVLRPLIARWRETRTIGAGLAACLTLAAVTGIGQRAATISLLQLLSLRDERHTVSAPYGTIIFKDKKRADEIRELLAIVLENTTEKDHIFVIPWHAPAIYALTRRCNPTYYDSMIDLFFRPRETEQRQVCEALLAKNTKLIIGRSDMPGAGWDNIHSRTQLPLLDAFVDEHFERTSDIGQFSVYLRRPK